MATIPTTQQLRGDVNSPQIINAVLNNDSAFDAVPRAVEGDISTIHTIGDILNGDIDLSNSFMKGLFNRIIQTVLQGLYFTNPWKRFKRGFLEAGDVIEEIAFTLANPHIYDTTEDTAFPKQEIPDIKVALHKINYKKYYKRTVNRQKLLAAFTSYDGMERFVNEIISTLYTSAEYDEYVGMKYMIGRAVLNGYLQTIEVPGNATVADAQKTVTSIKAISNNMTILRTGYNYSGLPTRTLKENQIIIVNSDFDAALDVEVLAYMFNMEKGDLGGRRILMDSFNADDVARMNLLFKDEEGFVPFTAAEITALNKIPAILLDDRFFMIFDAAYEATVFFNPEKLYWNYWLHCWRIMSFSTFVNAIGFSSQVATITALTWDTTNPTSVARGGNAYFTVTPTYSAGTPGTSDISWSISGNVSSNTYILKSGANQGQLFVDPAETATTLTVTASSGTVTAQSNVTLTGTLPPSAASTKSESSGN